jgi:Na+-driven multidrug efflux pump
MYSEAFQFEIKIMVKKGRVSVNGQTVKDYSLKVSENDVISVDGKILDTEKFVYIIVPIVFSVNGLLNGAGHTAFSLFNGMLSAVLLRAPFAILLGKVFSLGMLGIGLGGPIASLGSAIIGLIYVQSGRWKLSKIESK